MISSLVILALVRTVRASLTEIYVTYPIIFSELEVIKHAAVSLREIILIFLNHGSWNI